MLLERTARRSASGVPKNTIALPSPAWYAHVESQRRHGKESHAQQWAHNGAVPGIISPSDVSVATLGYSLFVAVQRPVHAEHGCLARQLSALKRGGSAQLLPSPRVWWNY